MKLGICAHVLGVETEERTSEPCVRDVSVDCVDCEREVCCKFGCLLLQSLVKQFNYCRRTTE